MINPMLKMEIDELMQDMAFAEKYPNIWIFLEKTQKTMNTAQQFGL